MSVQVSATEHANTTQYTVKGTLKRQRISRLGATPLLRKSRDVPLRVVGKLSDRANSPNSPW